jgi:glycosyltransferase involved in cell wall biosynthesis
MRLLYLVPENWPTHRADVAALFGKYLPRHGIHSDLIAGSVAGDKGAVEWGGGDAILCDISGGQAKKHIKLLLHGIYQLLLANHKRYSAIQVRDMPVLGAIGVLLARLKGMPFFYWMSYPMSEGQIAYARERGLSQGLMKFLFPWVRGRVGRFLLYRLILPSAHHVFVQSDRMKQDMVSLGASAERTTPVPMGVDLEVMRVEEIPPIDDPRLSERRVLVYLGTLDPARRIEVLFDMLSLVRQDIPDALLVLVGDTSDDHHRRWLKGQAEVAGVAEHIVWTGWLPMFEGWRYVRGADVALSPIPRGFLLDRSSPTKVPEYLALRVPVVCNDNPDQAAMVTRSNCGICVTYTAREFADAVLNLLALDEEARNRIAIAGCSYVTSERAYKRIARQVAEVYARILAADRTVNTRPDAHG